MDLSKLSDQDLEAVAAGDMTKVSEAGLTFLAGSPSTTPPPAQEDPGMVAKSLDYLGRGLDYTSGLGRTAVGAGLGAITGEDVIKEGDVERAFKGQAPSGEELLSRAQIPEGARVDLMPEVNIPLTGIKLGEGDSSMRDVAGLGLEIGADPLTYVTLGATGAAKALASPLSKASEKLGKTLYKSGFKKIDENLVEKGLKPLSEVALELGAPAGSVKGLSKKIADINKKLLEERSGLYQQIKASGQTVDIPKAMEVPIARGEELLRRNPALDTQMGSMEDWLLKYGKEGEQVPVDLASDWKTTLYQGLPQNAYTPLGKVMPAPKEYQKAFAQGLKEQIEAAGERSGKGLGKKIAEINENIGSIIESQKPMAREVRKANTKNAISSVDAGIIGYALKDPITASAVLGSKKIGDLAKTTAFRTGVGGKMYEIGTAPIRGAALDIGARRALSPWLQMNNEENK
jgi:hypothetical protein